MSKDQGLQIEDLEQANTEATAAGKEEKAPKAPKVVTQEEIDSITAGVAKMTEMGVSTELAKVLELVPVWHDKDASAPVKAAVIEHFGSSDKFKNYIDGPFQEELSVFAGINKSVSTLNNIKSFYARREGTKKVKLTPVTIGGETYDVNAEFLLSLKDASKEDKRAALLAHADTKKNEAMEVL